MPTILNITMSVDGVVAGLSGGEGPWEDDPNASGWLGDDPPFGGSPRVTHLAYRVG
jgi:hypothetical protein